MNDMDTIQKLELDLEKLTAQKRMYEEKGKKCKEDSEQVNFSWHLGDFILVEILFQLVDSSNAWLESY